MKAPEGCEVKSVAIGKKLLERIAPLIRYQITLNEFIRRAIAARVSALERRREKEPWNGGQESFDQPNFKLPRKRRSDWGKPKKKASKSRL